MKHQLSNFQSANSFGPKSRTPYQNYHVCITLEIFRTNPHDDISKIGLHGDKRREIEQTITIARVSDLSTIYTSFGYCCRCYINCGNIRCTNSQLEFVQLLVTSSIQQNKPNRTLCKYIQLPGAFNGNERFLINENHYNWN